MSALNQDASGPADEGLDQSRLTHLVGYASTRASIAMRKVFARHCGPLDMKVVEFSILMLGAANAEVNRSSSGRCWRSRHRTWP